MGDRHFQSMPAVFGKPFSIVGSYDTAHLQILEENPFLCRPGLDPLNERHLKRNTKSNETNSHIVPTDGLPGKKYHLLSMMHVSLDDWVLSYMLSQSPCW